MAKIKEPVVFVSGLFYQEAMPSHKIDELIEFGEKYCELFVVHRRDFGLGLVNRSAGLVRELAMLKKFHVIGHSAGGVDARLALDNLCSPDALKDKCLSLTTVGTPHAGSVIADYFFVKPDKTCQFLLQEMLGINPKYQEIVHELTYEYMSQFNKKHPEPKIPCFSLPFIIDKKWKVSVTDKLAYAYSLSLGHTMTDGVVSLPSQIFGKTVGDYPMSNIRINHGCHKAEMAPLRYGLPFQSIWRDTFRKCFQNILNLENGITGS